VTPRFFRSAAEFRAWLTAHHADTRELWVGFYKKDSGKHGITYPEAVDEALCFGWIDGLKKRVDEHAYMHRFSPRTARSAWSDVNTRRVAALKRRGVMHPAGVAAYANRDRARTAEYSYENRPQSLSSPLLRQFKATREAWTFFEAQPNGYRRLAIFWVMSAKRDATRERRLAQLIAESAQRRRVVAISGQRDDVQAR
jgi:uncharacterized protein YdeI (YjbR/CyaY-like superfamily)